MDKILSQWSGKHVSLKKCEQPLPLSQLSLNERKVYDSFLTQSRKTDWLKGRNALKELLLKNGQSSDTQRLSFPNQAFSLTHNDGLAIAITMNDVAGVGVDFEAWHKVKPQMAHWFLNNTEQSWLSTLSSEQYDKEFVRLWTVKEALFKAAMNNEQLALIDFQLDQPSAMTGIATVDNHPSWLFYYKCIVDDVGALCVAFSQRSTL
ncbi:4'-phosphopantetheinyl transferase superfamily protein [Thalassotalea fonticola]|uniref:4'-phosphopantetheinyl transferase superfamily protein n=1 Tax=Thalassotalea fonticola TaxID=3065649 RepID=A0ABZ0GTL9_9GAMM|nr:4'-phosphopantetheinyl transferase superfamily protein [Colwelliaceae bacterium S1-1]